MFNRFLVAILLVAVLLCFVACSNVNQKESEMNMEEQKWNKMWELWAAGKSVSPYAELMTYQSEVNNGGHAQYFDNASNTGDLEKEMSILEQLLSTELKTNLKKAYEAYLLLEENEDDEAAAGSLEQCDSVFWEYEAEIHRVLEEYASGIEP